MRTVNVEYDRLVGVWCTCGCEGCHFNEYEGKCLETLRPSTSNFPKFKCFHFPFDASLASFNIYFDSSGGFSLSFLSVARRFFCSGNENHREQWAKCNENETTERERGRERERRRKAGVRKKSATTNKSDDIDNGIGNAYRQPLHMRMVVQSTCKAYRQP